MVPVPWTEEEDDLAHRLKSGGYSYVEIAKHLKETFGTTRTRDAVRNRVRNNTPSPLHPVIESRQQQQQSEKERIASLEKLVEQQQEIIERQRKPRIKLGAAKPHVSEEGEFIRVVIPDTHGCHIDPDAASAFLHDLERLRPKEIVMLGDHLDCGGFLAQHHVWGYVAEMDYTFTDDCNAANSFLDSVQSFCPNSAIHYIAGNHENRCEKWCVTQSLRTKVDAQFLLKMFSAESVLSLEKRGIKYYKQGEFYHGLKIPATIKLGHCHFTHGTRCGVNAARQTLVDFGGNVVFGHTHRITSSQAWNVSDGDMAAWNIGFLAKVQPYWMHTKPSGWSHGYAVQFVRPSGDFLHVTVPIIDGKSYLVPLVSHMG